MDRRAEVLNVGEAYVCLSGGCSPPLGEQSRAYWSVIVELPGTIGQLQALKHFDVRRGIVEKKMC